MSTTNSELFLYVCYYFSTIFNEIAFGAFCPSSKDLCIFTTDTAPFLGGLEDANPLSCRKKAVIER